MRVFPSIVLVLLVGASVSDSPAATVAGAPSRPPVKGCAWEKIANAAVGLEAWVQRCDFGFRKIDFLFAGNSLAIRYSDGGALDPLIDVIDLAPDETPEAGVRRVFDAKTDKAVAARCELAPFRGAPARGDAKRYTFVPDAAYRRGLEAAANPEEVGEPPCGELGESPDGIQYFEVQPSSNARKVLFVRVGQDEPLFDEASLRLVP
jgi:hypothetical protein